LPRPDLSVVVAWATRVLRRVADGVQRMAAPLLDATIVVVVVTAAVWAGLVQLYFDSPSGACAPTWPP